MGGRKDPAAKRAYQREYYRKNREHVKARNRLSWHRRKTQRANQYKRVGRFLHVQRTYNITPEEYARLLEKADYACMICKIPFSDAVYACVDHAHDDGHVRGVLCRKCNTGLGMFDDRVELIAAATDYLREN